jgi:hypothetical protein
MEKSLFAQVGEIHGKKQEGTFSTSFQYTPTDERLKQLRGMVFALVEVKAESEDKGLAVSKGIFDSFKTAFFEATGSNLKAMEEAVDSVKEAIDKDGVAAQLLIACLWGSVLYIGRTGDSSLFLARDGEAKKINFSKVASGSLTDRDGIFLTDSAFSENIDTQILGKIASKEEFNESLDDIRGEIKEKGGEALYVRLSVQEPVEKTYPVLIADLDKEEGAGVPIGKEEGKKLDETIKEALNKIPRPKVNFDFLSNVWFRAKLETRKILSALKPYVRKALFVILSPWLPRLPGELEEEASRKKKRIAEIALVLIAVLLLSISIGFISHSRSVAKEKFNNTVSSVESKLSEAENLEKLDPNKAASLVSEAGNELNKLSGSKDPKVKALREKLSGLLTKISRIYNPDTKLVSDMSLLKGKIDVKNIKTGSGVTYALDVNSGSIYKIPQGGSPEIFVSEKKGLQNFSSRGSGIYIQTKDGIETVDQDGNESKQIGNSSSWKNLIEAETYKENFYLLDSDAHQVWRYVSTGTALGGPQKYLAENFNGQAVSFAIDGSVWIATKDNVFNFFGGKKQEFSVKNQPREISEIADIYTKEEISNLYILDKGLGGVFVFDKTGDYQALYLNNNLKNSRSLVVDESKKIIYFLAQNILYSFKLQ